MLINDSYNVGNANIKWLIVLLSIFSLIGFLVQYSSSGGTFGYYSYSYLIKLFIAIVVLIVCSKVNMNFIYKMTPYIYCVCLILLALVPIIGTNRLGATRWVNVGGFGILYFQPSELMKIALILMLSRHFHQFNISSIGRFRFYVLPIIYSMVPFFFILIQPDLGTALIITGIALIMFFIGGFRMRYFVVLGTLIAITLPIMWFNFMHDYQKRRVITFIDPSSDSRGAGYHIIQSKIAIGAGGFSGKGYLNGSQNQLDFLPEKHSDFIFTLFAEEFGFLGSFFLLILYASLLVILFSIAANSYNLFNKFIVSGTMIIVFVYTFINIGMVSGLLPIVGVPLPFLSFGGTSLITLMSMFGLTINIAKNDNKQNIA